MLELRGAEAGLGNAPMAKRWETGFSGSVEQVLTGRCCRERRCATLRHHAAAAAAAVVWAESLFHHGHGLEDTIPRWTHGRGGAAGTYLAVRARQGRQARRGRAFASPPLSMTHGPKCQHVDMSQFGLPRW